jgi:hypothetical protein
MFARLTVNRGSLRTASALSHSGVARMVLYGGALCLCVRSMELFRVQ